MGIVNTVEHEILIVPTESSKSHANIEPREVNPIDVRLSRELHETVIMGRNIIQVPWVIQISILLRVYNFLRLVAET